MLILQRYLLRESLMASLLSLAVFLAVVSALFLAELLGEAAGTGLPLGGVALMLFLRLPEALLLVGPLALMTGLLLTLGRLHDMSEFVVMRSGAAGFGRCLLPVGLLALGWSAALLVVAGWVAPLALDRASDVMADAARQTLVAGVQPGQFERMDQGRLTVYVGSVDRSDGQVRDVFVHFDDPDDPEFLTAARGRLWSDPERGGRYLSLFDGQQTRHAPEPAGAGLRQIGFERNDIRLPEPVVSPGQDEELGLTLPELWPPATPAERREWHWRLAAPATALLLGLMAMPLAHRSPRQGRFSGVVVALLIYLVYSNAVHAGLVLIEQRDVLAGPGLWPLHGGLAVLTAVLVLRQRRDW